MGSLNRLAYFNCVVETGSISQASRIFDVQPSSISRQLTALETELGIQLLNKTTRNISLTEAGRQYYVYSQRIVLELEAAKRAVNDLQAHPTGRLKVSMTVGFGESVILPLIPEFNQRFPDIYLELELTERVADLVEDNIDIAIRSGYLPDSTMVGKKLMDNNFLLCASDDYLSRSAALLSPAGLTDHQCILYRYSGWQDWFLMEEKAIKLSIKHGLSVNSVNGQKQLLLNHAGLALMPYWAVKNEIENGKLVHVLPEYQFSPYERLSSTYAVYLKRHLTPPKNRAFIDFMSEKINNSQG